MSTRSRILELIKEKEQLPPFPQVLNKLDKMLHDPDIAVADFAKLIETDPVLTGRLMKLANSAYYGGGRQEVKTLSLAVGRLGLSMVHRLIYSLSLSNMKGNPKIVKHRAFWRHSLAVAVFTKSLCNFVGDDEETQDLAYMSGLMHDIGILVFSTLLPLEYGAMLKELEVVDTPLDELEQEKFGIDHAELGAIYMENWWQIHPMIVGTVQYHHFPFRGEELVQYYAQIVNVSNGICNNQGIVNGIEKPGDFFQEGAWMELGLSLEDTDQILVQVKKSLFESELMLGS
jgi:HD-like signal output (HDOD) protein